MPVGQHSANYRPGTSGNPNGRPVGSRNKRTQGIIKEIQKLDHKDCLMRLSEIVHSEPDTSLAISASTALAPYMHGKMGTIPPPRYVEEPFTVPTFQTIDQAEDYLAEIPQRVARGELDFQSGLDFSAMIRNWIEAKLAHTNTDLKVAAQGGGDATIRIEGGMPSLPGTSIIMDDTPFGSRAINGHSGPSIEHQPSDAPVTARGRTHAQTPRWVLCVRGGLAPSTWAHTAVCARKP
jgi:hypothetical protein